MTGSVQLRDEDTPGSAAGASAALEKERPRTTAKAAGARIGDQIRHGEQRGSEAMTGRSEINFNAYRRGIKWDDGARPVYPTRYSTNATTVHVYFDELQQHLAQWINRYEATAGCVAWLTDPAVMDALISKEEASIVINKEDFKRPDHRVGTDYGEKLKTLESGKSLFGHGYAGEGAVSHDYLDRMSVACAMGMQRVRCAGGPPGQSGEMRPTMHHKFFVFGEIEEDEERRFAPKAVWAGSYNPTLNAARSFENATVMVGEEASEPFLNEFVTIWSLSEPIDWSSKYMEPELRFGT